VAAHLDGRQRNLLNLRRDPRVGMSFESPTTDGLGLTEYLVVHGP
jgi:hypothetical protein